MVYTGNTLMDQFIVGFGLFVGFVDKRKNIGYNQTLTNFSKSIS